MVAAELIGGDRKDRQQIGINQLLPQRGDAWIILSGARRGAVENRIQVVGERDASGSAIAGKVIGGIGEQDDHPLGAETKADLCWPEGNLQQSFQL